MRLPLLRPRTSSLNRKPYAAGAFVSSYFPIVKETKFDGLHHTKSNQQLLVKAGERDTSYIQLRLGRGRDGCAFGGVLEALRLRGEVLLGRAQGVEGGGGEEAEAGGDGGGFEGGGHGGGGGCVVVFGGFVDDGSGCLTNVVVREVVDIDVETVEWK